MWIDRKSCKRVSNVKWSDRTAFQRRKKSCSKDFRSRRYLIHGREPLYIGGGETVAWEVVYTF